MSESTFAKEGYSHDMPFDTSVVFAAAYALGVGYRRSLQAHGRFMRCAALPLIEPVIGRVRYFDVPPLPSPWL